MNDEETLSDEKSLLPEGYDIEIRDLSFIYPDTKEAVLRNVSITVREGENIALIGGTGSGKTTLIRLLTGLFEPTEGEIILGGINYRQIKKADIF